MRVPLIRTVLASVLATAILGVARSASPPVVERPRVDAVGDPLPDDAVARIGTARFRDENLCGMVNLSPDGKLLAVPRYGEIRLLDTTTGKEIRRITDDGHYFHYAPIIFSPDGKLFAASDHYGLVLCDVMKAQVLCRFSGSERFGWGRVAPATVSFSI